ncbi:TfdA family Taurine catabolism dioxygenase TauD [Schizosaccharomyces cryophilus OY26]|uniref:TfdA family Taurine catabolism dioxygenase TauD n=1 Tax=Schizosaccharomyces cryophilus (strain OY26 / ATCC MYA-4695 / CBS 11777 / NBRC 106824 / NRRL Y48691) TaxID=653667 RepID=S9X8I1_SCHCR|nr:TfdA family Taurine catabolism dioxygenase TauD [Schizosaccharomyces cryophilus OY26]EPY50136.1 TfdA family Taurine catabolism dioxygenase TauD [Schizosaccharomyces cryophilus OY26]
MSSTAVLEAPPKITLEKHQTSPNKSHEFQLSKNIFNGNLTELPDGDHLALRDSNGTLKTYALPKDYEFAELLPFFPDSKDKPLDKVEFYDRGLNADPSFSNLFRDLTKIEHLARDLGTVLHGVQLSKLDNAQKDELARLIAERGVVYFPDQEQTIEEFEELGLYYGSPHIHGANAIPRNERWKNFHVVYSDKNTRSDVLNGLPQIRYLHTDVSFEEQPTAQTFFKALKVPDQGGDTVFVSGYAAYEALSEPMKNYLEGLTLVHSGVEQAERRRQAGHATRREGILTAHPIIRTHPVTGWKSLYVSPEFSRYIPEIPRAESDAILNFLYQHLASLSSSTVKIQWSKNGVVAWDNRIVVHRATYDHIPQTRHFIRIAARGEKPFLDKNSRERKDVLSDSA